MKPSAVMARVRSLTGNEPACARAAKAGTAARGVSLHTRSAYARGHFAASAPGAVAASARIQRLFLVCRTGSPGFEQAAVVAVVTLRQRQQHLARRLERHVTL